MSVLAVVEDAVAAAQQHAAVVAQLQLTPTRGAKLCQSAAMPARGTPSCPTGRSVAVVWSKIDHPIVGVHRRLLNS